MKHHDLGSSLFWLLVAVYASLESLRMGVGTLQKPGMGFITFGTSVLLGILSLAVFLRTIIRTDHLKAEPLFAGKLWKRVVFVLIALVVYAKVMPVAGYLISTFCLMGLLFWVVKGQRWWWVLFSSFLTTVITYYVFSVWLKGQLPEGLLSF